MSQTVPMLNLGDETFRIPMRVMSYMFYWIVFMDWKNAMTQAEAKGFSPSFGEMQGTVSRTIPNPAHWLFILGSPAGCLGFLY